jgi:lambda repressor-like predicted transcriptional regulator
MDKKTKTNLAWYSKEINKDSRAIEKHKKQLIAKIKKQGIGGLLNTEEVKKDYKESTWLQRILNRIWNNLKKLIGF